MKNRINKRIASVFLCLIVVLTTINLPKFTMEVKADPASGVRASGTCGTDVNWILYNDGQLVISGSGDMANYPTHETPWDYYLSSISSVVIESGVTSIGKNAFSYCSNLLSISLPSGITKIEHSAFFSCSQLANINIPSGVTYIGSNAFYGCWGLTRITIPSGVTEIKDNAFDNCVYLSSISLPDGLTTIGNNAFYNCMALSSIEIPASVTSMGYFSFDECSSLSEVTFNSITPPSNVENARIPVAANIKVPDGSSAAYIAKGFPAGKIIDAAAPIVPPTAPGNSSSKSSSNSDSNKVHSHSLSWVVTKEPTYNSDGTSSLVCSSCGHVESSQTISRAAVVYTDVANKFEVNLRNIELQPGNEALLELGDWHSVPSYLMERVIKSNVDVEITYKYQGKNYDIIVPAGKGIDLHIPWYGPLLMNAMYGEK